MSSPRVLVLLAPAALASGRSALVELVDRTRAQATLANVSWGAAVVTAAGAGTF